jgi:signal transduction histidine kinase
MDAADDSPEAASSSRETNDNRYRRLAKTPPPLRRSDSSLRTLSELTRERISLRYLHAWTELYKPEFIDRNAFPKSTTIPAPAACHDSGLAAFAQLAALRIGVRRAFVTIMSRETEYVLVEATRTMSLQSDHTADAKDKSWLGTSCFARADGLNDAALDGWRKARQYRKLPADEEHYYIEGISPHWYILSDASLNPSVRERPFVARAQSLRFFFSVPLRDTDGTVIGSLSMLDDKPRHGVSANDMLFCEDLSDTIAQHILGSTIATQRQRSERLIQALGTFNSGGKSLKDWWIGQDNKNLPRGGRRRTIVHDDDHDKKRFEREFGAEEDHINSSRQRSRSGTKDSVFTTMNRLPRSVSDGNDQAVLSRVDNHVSEQDFSGGTAQTPRQDHGIRSMASGGPEYRRVSSQSSKDFESTAAIKDMYSRASTLLRESTGAAGVAYLDSSPLNSSALTPNKSGQTSSSSNTTTSPSASSDDSRLRLTSDTDFSDSHEQRSRLCKVIGLSTQVQSAEDKVATSPLQLMERDLAKLIKLYPSGKVFNYALSGTPYSGSDDSAGSGGASSESTAGTGSKPMRTNTKHNRHARLLRKVVGDARSIAFYPIWDAANKKYSSCLFAWTLHPNRFFDTKEDMTYICAFGHSLRAEISRIETIASDLAKGKFISSVSHELRSPLHGILAGIELLQETRLTPFQQEMSLSVAVAGRTLLDTVDHILDYSKISNLTRGQKKDRARVDAARHKSAHVTEGDKSLLTVVDLARMTEEVVESVVSAHRFSQSFECNSPRPKRQSPPYAEKEKVSLILDIEKRDSWATAMTPGSWTRVLNNIIGNSLKYTHSGSITVKLFTNHSSAVSANDMEYVTFQVEDTGIGMTQDFISNDLFTPFRQADHHSAGTGLGLSIVKEVAKEFGGVLKVDSEVGKGSRLSLTFNARFIEFSDASDQVSRGPQRLEASRLCMLHMADYPDASVSSTTQGVAESLQRTASQWLGCEIKSSQVSAPASRHILCVISEEELLSLNATRKDGVKNLIATLADSGSRLLIFGRSITSCQPEFDFAGFAYNPIYIHQP